MQDSENILDEFSEFPIPTYEEWSAITEAQLKGASIEQLVTSTYEGILLQPMYQQANIAQLFHTNTSPGQPPYIRGTHNFNERKNRCYIAQAVAETTPMQFNKAALEELTNGVTMLKVVLHDASKGSQNPNTSNTSADKCETKQGLFLSTKEDFQVAFNGIDFNKTPVFIDIGSLSIPFLSHFLVYAKEQRIPFTSLKGCIGMDPLGVMVENGSLPFSLECCYDTMSQIVKWAMKNKTLLKTIVVKGEPYHNGGASAVEELGFSLATAVEYIRALLEHNLTIDEISSRITFSFSIGSNLFMEVAKFRAARLLWPTIVNAFGGNDASQKITIHARTSTWNKSTTDPYVNIFRTTSEAFSAVIGGVDSLHVSTYDEFIQAASPFSRRIARNIQLILQEESYLANIIDPAGGSWYIEKLTDELAKKAWNLFQQTEALGGLLKALQIGFPQETVAKTAAKRKRNIEQCKDIFVGVNRYVDALEKTNKKIQSPVKHVPRDENNFKTIVFKHDKNLLDQVIEEIINNGTTIGTLADAFKTKKDTFQITSIKKVRGLEAFEKKL